MGEDWVRIKSFTDRFNAEILLGMLLSNDIRAVKLNQQDSAYLNIGSIELFVHRDDFVKATFLIENPNEE